MSPAANSGHVPSREFGSCPRVRVPLSGADITGREEAAVLSVLRSGVLSLGPVIGEFEELVRARVGTRHAVAVNSGTSALHLLVRAMNIGDGDEVITTPFSFVASSNCILYERGMPIFVDVEPETGNIDLNRLEDAITRRTRGIIPVDVFGQPVNMKAVMELARRHGLKVIEDACEAIGSEFEGAPCGSLADGAAFAFYPNKQITTGEGGMVVTNDDRVAGLCRSMRNQGRAEADIWLSHERLGYNYRLSELHAALGKVQMQRLDEIIGRRAAVAVKYDERLAGIPEVTAPFIAQGVTRMSRQVYVVRVDDEIDRDAVMHFLSAQGIGCRPYFTPIHLQPYYVEEFGYKPGDFPQAERLGRQTIALPFFNHITDEQIDYVAANLEQGCRRFRRVGAGQVSRETASAPSAVRGHDPESQSEFGSCPRLGLESVGIMGLGAS